MMAPSSSLRSSSRRSCAGGSSSLALPSPVVGALEQLLDIKGMTS
jgi:hypothetical protein